MMKIDGAYDHDALHALGASSVTEIRDSDGNVIGHEVEPEVDMAGYDAALSKLAKDKRGTAWNQMRNERDRLLRASDWTQAQDAPLSEGARVAWKSYREALRQLPQNTADPASVEWPLAPT